MGECMQNTEPRANAVVDIQRRCFSHLSAIVALNLGLWIIKRGRNLMFSFFGY